MTTATRSPVLPDIPTVAESVPGYESSFWTGVGAPKNTPAEIVDKLNKEMNATLADPKFKARLADLGGTALSGSPLDFGNEGRDVAIEYRWAEGRNERAAKIAAEFVRLKARVHHAARRRGGSMAVPPVLPTERIAHLSYGRRLLRCRI